MQTRPRQGPEGPSGAPKGALPFILITVLVNMAGIGIIAPVSPFIAERYGADGFAIGMLFTAYSIASFIALPGLGALSDRFGRKPILIISLLGSAVGYLITGVGGALWVLFLGRIIDGLTGANISTIYAYVSDITQPRDRARYFGLLGAMAGLGFVIGPVIGGLFSRISYEAPLFVAAAITLINAGWGWAVMKESLPAERRSASIRLQQLNPAAQLADALKLPQLRWTLIATLLVALTFAALQANLSVLLKDTFRWGPDAASVIFTVFGVIGIVVQGGLVRALDKRVPMERLALAGLALMTASFVMVGFVPVLLSPELVFAAVVVMALGNSLVTPALASLISAAVGPRDQGRVQGSSQALQAMGRIAGPAFAGTLYEAVSHGAPYFAGAFQLVLSIAAMAMAIPGLNAARQDGARLDAPHAPVAAAK